jgi:small subunit ribosomal protein S16
MLVIRMQRTGRKGHAMFRVVVQDSRRTPTSGKVVASLGSYDPHAKTVILDKEKAASYLKHGAQPSTRVARLLKSEGVKLPDWVKLPANKERVVKNAEKRRSTAPAKPVEEVPTEAAPEEVPVEEVPAEETPAETPEAEEPAEATPTVEIPEEAVETVNKETAEAPAEEATDKPAEA